MNTDADVTLQSGDDDTIVTPIKDIDDPNQDWVSDLSSHTFEYDVRDRKLGGSVVLDENDLTITTDQAQNIVSEDLDQTGVGDTDDVVLIKFTTSDTDTLSGTYWHKLKATDGSGTTQTVFRGRVTIEG